MTGAPCAVEFCAAMAGAYSEYCAVHKERPELRPTQTPAQVSLLRAIAAGAPPQPS